MKRTPKTNDFRSCKRSVLESENFEKKLELKLNKWRAEALNQTRTLNQLYQDLKESPRVHSCILMGTISLNRDHALHIAGASDYDKLTEVAEKLADACRQIFNPLRPHFKDTQAKCTEALAEWNDLKQNQAKRL